MNNHLEVKNPSWNELFTIKGGDYKIEIPPYQRPYVWDNKKVEQLLIDWNEFIDSDFTDNSWYYMGSIIIHINEDEKVLNIVDGQQRLTTLLIIDNELHGKDSALNRFDKQLKFNFSHHLSRKNISCNTRLIKKLIASKKYNRIKDKKVAIFDHLKFSVILTDSEDDAFTFFDSQNNRGIQPAAVDVMKAVHLRAIKNDENLRKDCAIKWQDIQLTPKNIFRNSQEDYLDNLVDMALWRIRCWKGATFENNANYNSAMDEFANNPKKGHGNIVKYYSKASNETIRYTDNLATKQSISDTENAIDKLYPFSIRQPLFKGVSVFTYFETYHRVAQKLFQENTDDSEINKVRKFYETIYEEKKCSKYMSDYFIIMMIAYYDKFGTNKLYHFALLIDYVIGTIRLNSYYFKEVTMRNLMSEHNILDIIQLSFEPDEIFNYITSLHLKDENRHPENGPINNYINACKNYFNRSFDGDLRDVKLNWIENCYE